MLSLTLSERLTDEERNKIRALWKEAKGCRNYQPSAYLRGRFRAMQDVFGRDMFKKQEGDEQDL